jgi:hypothetical protein
MLIPIRLPDDQQQEGAEIPEWSLVELNGTLNASGETIAGLELGQLTFVTKEKVRASRSFLVNARRLRGKPDREVVFRWAACTHRGSQQAGGEHCKIAKAVSYHEAT